MEIPDRRTMVLDGSVYTGLMSAGMPADTGRISWINSNTDKVDAIYKAFAKAGAQIVSTPTFGVTRSALALSGDGGSAYELNLQLAGLTRKAVGYDMLVAGGVSPCGVANEEIEDNTFSRMTDEYSEQLAALAQSGVDLFFLENFSSMMDMRAAILSARQFDKPIYLTVTADEDGYTEWGCDVLAMLVVAQSLGVKAFGVSCVLPSAAKKIINRLYPYAAVPLIARVDAGEPNPVLPMQYDLSPSCFAAEMTDIMRAGASIVGGCCGATDAHIAELKEAVHSFDFSAVTAEKKTDEPIAANHKDAFLLTDNMEISDEIDCSYDMSADIIGAEEDGCEVLLISVKSVEDSVLLSQNAHMFLLPCILKVDDRLTLEAVLAGYQGRAIVDSQSMVDAETLKTISARYGAIIY